MIYEFHSCHSEERSDEESRVHPRRRIQWVLPRSFTTLRSVLDDISQSIPLSPVSSPPEASSPSSASFGYFTATLVKLKEERAPARMRPGRKMMRAFSMREALWSSSVTVDRYDIHGKKLLESNEKLYFGDVGLRNLIAGGEREGDIEKIMENIVYQQSKYVISMTPLVRRRTGRVLSILVFANF